jgi:L-alanine-DL-glutamate epimerase-like enolase superfamily enzyme
VSLPEKRTGPVSIKITDLKCAIIGQNPVIRVVADQGISGYGEAESVKNYLKPMVLFYKQYLLGEDPTDVQRVMLKIRRMGAFQALGRGGERHRDRSVGHCRADRRRAGL